MPGADDHAFESLSTDDEPGRGTPLKHRARTRRLAVLSALAVVFWIGRAGADEAATGPTWTPARSLEQRFGVEVVRRLLKGDEQGGGSLEEAVRGIERAVAPGSESARLVLLQFLEEPRGLARDDARVLLAATRALAPWADQAGVARVLGSVVLEAPAGRGVPEPGGRPIRVADPGRRARLELARATAALALARSGDPRSVEGLFSAAQGGGVAQSAARRALIAFPPVGTAWHVATPGTIALSMAVGDLRAMDLFLEGARSPDPQVRSPAFRALAMYAPERGVAVAKDALGDADPRVREAATRVLVEAGSPDASAAVRRLIEDEATASDGVGLADRIKSVEISQALAARVKVVADRRARGTAIAALGRQREPEALTALRAFLLDPTLEGDAAQAIARSPIPDAWATVVAALGQPATARLGARMGALRGLLRGKVPADVWRRLRLMSHAPNGADRAAAVSALVALGDRVPAAGLADADPRVRRATAMACDARAPAVAQALLETRRSEPDAITRSLLARGLLVADGRPSQTTTALRDSVSTNGVDAPLSLLALARRATDADRDDLARALQVDDPILRAHAAYGLAKAEPLWASAELASAYELEVDAGARRAIVVALTARPADATLPVWQRALDRASRLDPDPAIRVVALRALRGLAPPHVEDRPELAWLRVTDADGRPPIGLVTGLVVGADDVGLPVAFDEDGFAIVRVPHGPARLVLAPTLPAYEATGR